MDIFDLPLDTTHLRHQLKWLSHVKKIPFRSYNKAVQSILNDPHLGKVWTRRRIIARLLERYGNNDQRTSQWHTKRSEMITASEVTKAFRTATPSARHELLLKKIEGSKPSDGSGMNTACAWGTQFEPIAKVLYCKLNEGGEVVDTSCVDHPTYPFLGASPDGIYFPPNRASPSWGKLIEFKCPISRKFDSTTPIPDAYYHQMQLQMECTNIDECDYVEMRFMTVQKSEWDSSTAPYKGRFAVYDDGVVSYDYEMSPEWKAQLKSRDEEYRVVWWVLANWRVANVKRDYSWLDTHIEDLKSFWAEVQHHRTNGTVPEKSGGKLTIEQHEPTTDQPDVLSPAHEAPRADPPVSDGSLSVHKKNATTLQFDLA